jgi:dienelactone hydrolase
MKRISGLLLVLTASWSAALAQSYTRVEDVIYLKQGGAAFTLDVFKPKKPTGAAVIHMVSGGWVSDHNSINLAIAEAAAQRGITMVEVVHGAQPRYKVPEIVAQVTRAVRFVRANAATYGINPNRIGITGGSAGGHLSLMVASQGGPGRTGDAVDKTSSALQAVAIFFPPTDFANYGRPNNQAFDSPLLKAAYGAAFVDDVKTVTPEKIHEISDSMSPINFFTAAMPPTLIIHGDADTLVPIQQSQSAIAKLQGLGVTCKLITVPGKGHGWPEMMDQYKDILDWFEKYLK